MENALYGISEIAIFVSEISLSRFLEVRQQLVRKYRTPALSALSTFALFKFNFTLCLDNACQQPIFLHCLPTIGTQDVFVPLITDFFWYLLKYKRSSTTNTTHAVQVSKRRHLVSTCSTIHVINEPNYDVKD